MGMIWNKNGISTTDRFNAAASGPKLNDTKNIQAADTRESGNVLTPEQRESRNNTIKNTLVSQSFSGEIKAGKPITVNLPNGKYTVDFVKDPSTGGGRILVSHKGGSPDEAKAIIRAAQEVITGKPVSNTLPEYNKRINAESILSAGENPKEPLSKNTPILIGKTIIKSEIPESKSYLSALANRGVDSKLSTDDLSNIFKNIDENPNIKDKTAAKEEVVTYLKLDTESTRGKGPENTISKYLNKSEVERQPDIGTPGKPMVPSKPPAGGKDTGEISLHNVKPIKIMHGGSTPYGEPGKTIGLRGVNFSSNRETVSFYLFDSKSYGKAHSPVTNTSDVALAIRVEGGAVKNKITSEQVGNFSVSISAEEAFLNPIFEAKGDGKDLRGTFGINEYQYNGLFAMSGKPTERAEGHQHRLLTMSEIKYMVTRDGSHTPSRKDAVFSGMSPELANHILKNINEIKDDGLKTVLTQAAQDRIAKAGSGT